MEGTEDVVAAGVVTITLPGAVIVATEAGMRIVEAVQGSDPVGEVRANQPLLRIEAFGSRRDQDDRFR